MNSVKQLYVYFRNEVAGVLTKNKDGIVQFRYDDTWLEKGFALSPLSLPLKKAVYLPNPIPFGGLCGVFADSLHYGWGRIIMDKLFLKRRINPANVDNFYRLLLVGNKGMGALRYELTHDIPPQSKELLNELKQECDNLYETPLPENIDKEFKFNGKLFVKIDNDDYIIKFETDGRSNELDSGYKTYQYMECAKDCGIVIPDCKLLPSEKCNGYFAVKRFDRENGKKIHMVSLSAIIETSFRLRNLDYKDLMKITCDITHNRDDLIQIFKLMCFNVFSHNLDDHAKNISYLYNDETNEWRLAPAYDLSYSQTPNNKRGTSVNGEAYNPTDEDMLAIAREIELDDQKAKDIIDEIREKTQILI